MWHCFTYKHERIRRDNQEWITQRHWQYWVHRTHDEDKFRDTSNIGYTRHMTKTNSETLATWVHRTQEEDKKSIHKTQKTNEVSYTDPTKRAEYSYSQVPEKGFSVVEERKKIYVKWKKYPLSLIFEIWIFCNGLQFVIRT